MNPDALRVRFSPVCPNCNRQIRWIVAADIGRRIPMDARAINSHAYNAEGNQLPGRPLIFVSHFLTCPHPLARATRA